MNSYLTVIKKYATFSGRARRQEYWMFFLFNFIISIALSFVDGMIGFATETGFGLLSGLYGLLVFIPSLAVLVRRLHDTDRSGWWFFIVLIPIVGGLVLFIFLVLEGTRGENRFGADPKADSAIPAAA
jgi:uncharacterized membrane protein YhaH (DUF805 family)